MSTDDPVRDAARVLLRVSLAAQSAALAGAAATLASASLTLPPRSRDGWFGPAREAEDLAAAGLRHVFAGAVGTVDGAASDTGLALAAIAS